MSKQKDVDDFYSSFGLITKKKSLDNELLHNLYIAPKKPKNKNKPHIQDVEKGATQQADLLYLPDDEGYKYALVVCDIGSRLTDAEPLKKKDAEAVLKGFKAIYKRKILSLPDIMLQVDAGAEFKSAVKKFFNDKDIIVRVGKVGHHQSQASVEAKNHIIGKALLMRMTAQELHTGETSTEWVEFLPELIEKLNVRLQKNNVVKDRFGMPIRCDKFESELLDEGEKVRVALDEPRNITTDNSKLHGKFRAGDPRWEIKPTEVKTVLLRPDQPPMYLTKEYPHTPFVREALQKVTGLQNLPPTSMIRKFIVEKILKSKKVKGEIFYFIKWKGFDMSHNTWEPRTNMIKDVPKLVEAFEND